MIACVSTVYGGEDIATVTVSIQLLSTHGATTDTVTEHPWCILL